MRLSDFEYRLPPELIAQQPVEPRDAARLLVLDRGQDRLETQHRVRDLPELLRPGDLLVANRSRVLPARILGQLSGGGRAEMLLLRRIVPGTWEALARPARRLRVDDVVAVAPELALRVVAAFDRGVRHIQVESDVADRDAALLAHGSVPLPPYIRGWGGDPERYQTVYSDADANGSAAAPTAGLHFTRELIERLATRGICFATLVLHVGLDTFRPVTEDDPRTHALHREWYTVPASVQEQIQSTRAAGGRIIAVGTTSVRALESWATTGQSDGWTTLYILPGHQFSVVDGLLTNFHLPASTLLMLVSAFAGRERVLAAYAEAVQQQCRFYSFGDAMLIV